MFLIAFWFSWGGHSRGDPRQLFWFSGGRWGDRSGKYDLG